MKEPGPGLVGMRMGLRVLDPNTPTESLKNGNSSEIKENYEPTGRSKIDSGASLGRWQAANSTVGSGPWRREKSNRVGQPSRITHGISQTLHSFIPLFRAAAKGSRLALTSTLTRFAISTAFIVRWTEAHQEQGQRLTSNKCERSYWPWFSLLRAVD